MNWRPCPFNSLRGRYLVMAALFAVLVIASASYVHLYVAQIGRASIGNIGSRNEAQQYSREIKDSLRRAEVALHAYVLTPFPAYQEAWQKEINTTAQYVRELSELPFVVQQGWSKEFEKLTADLQRLRHEAQILMYIRSNMDLLFPALKIMRSVIFPSHQAFTTAVGLAVEELRNGNGNSAPDAYWLFDETLHLWSQMVYTFRVYVAYRVGIFGNEDDGLATQSENIAQLYQELTARLAKLQAKDRAGVLPLQASASLHDMVHAAEAWHASYRKIQQIHRGEDWRLDVPHYENTIQPLYSTIWDTILTLDRRIEEASAKDVARLTTVAKDITQTLWALAFLSLIVIAGGFIYFSRTVLRPIESVTQALKTVAKGEGRAELPRGSTEETSTLIEAFAEMHKQVEYRQIALQYQALHDALTGLPNRVLLQDRLDQAVLGAQRYEESIALLVMDLNRFKEINDTLGHHMGDRVLQQVAERLMRLLRETDTVARLGGDEFAVLLPSVDEQHAKDIAHRVVRTLEQVFQVDEHNLYVGASIGIALFPQHGEDGTTLIQRADVAMYLAKRSNSGFAVYDFHQDQYSIGRLELVSELHAAISGSALDLYYQPKIALQSGAVVGVEALLRWQHPQRGFVPIDAIIAVAEETGMIRPLTLWVLNAALRQCAAWHRADIRLTVAVNLSMWNLQDPALYQQIEGCLRTWGVPPSSLDLEITESAMMADPARALDILLQLDALGVGLTIDDYGIGFSSLAYLKSLPLDELKIDKSFIMGMIHDENDSVIVHSTINLAHNLGLTVVAEGVENKDIYELLGSMGCDVVQGYYLGRPMPAGELERWLKESPWKMSADGEPPDNPSQAGMQEDAHPEKGTESA